MSDIHSPSPSHNNKYKGIRRRKWGKWVSEIRVPGSSERLWLGSYTTPEAAAVAYDVASYCLRGNSSPQNLNFPLMLPGAARVGMSPRSVQRAASDAGLAIDARYLQRDSKKGDERQQHVKRPEEEEEEDDEGGSIPNWGSESGHEYNNGGHLSISVEDYL